jgi:hypothetical protein
MAPIVEMLEEKEGIEIIKLEVWHNQENADEMRKLASILIPACGGVLGTPAFYNEKTKKAICGKPSYEKLKEWALE